MRLFVYGTLMRGEPNHRLLVASAFLGAAETRDRWTLLDLGAYPALVCGQTSTVHGEIFDVDLATLQRCDRLEGHPHHYRRTPIALADGSRASAYLLQRAPGGVPAIRSGMWRARVGR